jgi:hypothetical protein
VPVNASGSGFTPATIAAGQSLSGAIVTGALTLHGILLPASWTAASLSFQVAIDGGVSGNFYEMDSISGSLVYPVQAGHYLTLDPTLWRAVNCFKIRSGTLSSPVNQAALATLQLALTTLF